MPHLSQKWPDRFYTKPLNDFNVSTLEGEMFGIAVTGLETIDLIYPQVFGPNNSARHEFYLVEQGLKSN